jgi:hypothetical protein
MFYYALREESNSFLSLNFSALVIDFPSNFTFFLLWLLVIRLKGLFHMVFFWVFKILKNYFGIELVLDFTNKVSVWLFIKNETRVKKQYFVFSF